MEFHKAQKEIVKDTHRFRTVVCGRRFGKTTLAVYEMIGKAVAEDDKRIAYIAPNYQQARDICWNQLKKICLPITINTNESRLEIEVKTQKGGTSYIYLRGWESIDTLRGQFYDFLVLDEVASYRNFWTGWHEVLRPTLTDKEGHALFIGTPKGFNHFYDLFNTQNDDYKSFHFTSYDNPYIKKEEIDKAKDELEDNRFAQEYMGDFRKAEGLVYKEFDRERHVKDLPLYGNEEIITGFDFGYRNPSAGLKIYIQGETYYVEDEYYKRQQTNEQIYSAISAFNPSSVYADPAEPDRIEALNDKGLPMMSVSKDVVAGIDKVHQMLKSGNLIVSPKCTNLIYEFETYAHNEDKSDKNQDEKPVKMNDHALDALRYAIYNHDPVIVGELRTSYM